jgi:hypothetical protein
VYCEKKEEKDDDTLIFRIEELSKKCDEINSKLPKSSNNKK